MLTVTIKESRFIQSVQSINMKLRPGLESPVIPALRTLRQKDLKDESNPGYTAGFSLQKLNNYLQQKTIRIDC